MSRRGVKSNLKKGMNDDSDSKTLKAIVKAARQSGQLNLSNRQLNEVPSYVWRINVDPPEEVSVSLQNTDERWWDQVDLTKLILASNGLHSIPEDLELLPALQSLDLHDNCLENLPNSIGSLGCLTRLILDNNKLSSIPTAFGQLHSLQYLQLQKNNLTSIDGIASLPKLEYLNVSYNKISALPEEIGHLCKLINFDSSHNCITSIPYSFCLLKGITSLDLSYNKLNNLPSDINLPKLQVFQLRHNSLATFPNLINCSSLKEFYVGNNSLETISEQDICNLKIISILDLRDNKLSILPDTISSLSELTRLDVANNNLNAIPYSLGTLVNLKSVVLDGNPLKSIRRDIISRGTTELKKFLCSRMAESSENVEKSQIQASHGVSGIVGGFEGVSIHSVTTNKKLDYTGKKLNDEIWLLMKNNPLEIIHLSKNDLTEWPPQFDGCTGSTKELTLSFNKVLSIPCMYYLKNLLFLDLRNNLLSALPEDMSQLSHLRELIISCNRFSSVPSVLFSLSKLEILLANDNQICDIPANNFCSMGRLATLDLQNNNITHVPPELGLCSQLKSLQIMGNPFKVPRPAILAKGTDAILEHLKNKISS